MRSLIGSLASDWTIYGMGGLRPLTECSTEQLERSFLFMSLTVSLLFSETLDKQFSKMIILLYFSCTELVSMNSVLSLPTL